jgi:hypothetical protein
MERVVVHLAPCQRRNGVIEEVHELTQDSALRLSPESQEDEVLSRQQRIDEPRNDGILVALHAGKEDLSFPELANQVRANLVLDGPWDIARGLEAPERRGSGLGHRGESPVPRRSA